MRTEEKIKILLRGLANGDEYVFETPDDNYVAYGCKGTSLVPTGSVERTIESMLQLELYGEYPLSDKIQDDWDSRVKKAFNFKRK